MTRPAWREAWMVLRFCGVIVLVAVLSALRVPMGSQLSSSSTSAEVVGSIAPPGCSTKTAPGPRLKSVTTTFLSVRGQPFGLAVSKDGRWAFVGLTSSVAALSLTPPAPYLVHEVQLGQESFGVALTPDDRYLVAAGGSGAEVVDVTGLEQGSSDAVVGRFTSDGSGAIETAVSPDGHYVFVTLEDSDQLAVFNLERALSHGFGPYDLVGMIPLGEAPVGIAIAPDHRYMYATSEDEQGSRLGTLTTISLARAVTYPARAIVSTVVAGCSPVRVVTSPSTVYVTARGSDALVEFSAGALVSDPSHALVSSLRVGEAPVGVALVQEGKEIVVADSNRFGANGTAANIAVVRVTTGDRLSLVGYVPSGAFPRDMAVTLNGRRVLVSNYDSSQVETVEVPGTR